MLRLITVSVALSLGGCSTTHFVEPKSRSEHAVLKCDKGQERFGQKRLWIKEINGQAIDIAWRGTAANRRLPPGEVAVLAVESAAKYRATAKLEFTANASAVYLITTQSESEEDGIRFIVKDEASGAEVASGTADIEEVEPTPWWMALPGITVF